jgi:uncharacterized protein DUF2442
MAHKKTKSERILTLDELEQQFIEATRRGEGLRKDERRAKSVTYDGHHRRLAIEMMDGSLLAIPTAQIQGLKDASPAEIKTVELAGDTLQWESLDLYYSVAGLAAGRFGTNSWMAELGRRGGKVSSKAKAAAARQNGLRGGRPRKPSPPETLIISKTFKVLPFQPEAEPLEAELSDTSHMPTKDLIRYESGLCAIAWSLPRRSERTQSKLTRNTLSDVVLASLGPSQQDDMFWTEVKDNAGLAIAA